MVGPLLHKNLGLITPLQKETEFAEAKIKQCLGLFAGMRSIEAQFHDNRVFARTVVMAPQTTFFKLKFAVELPRRQVSTPYFECHQAGTAGPRLGNSLGN